MKIYKYPVPLMSCFTLNLPRNAKILHVSEQHGEPELVLWALVDPKQEKIEREFYIYGTGSEIKNVHYLSYIGTSVGNVYVCHLFEKVL